MTSERQSIEQNKLELEKSSFEYKSKLRENESNQLRYDKEIEKLTQETVSLKEQLHSKDNDFKSSFTKLTEMQSIFNEDKITLKAELM